MAVKRLKPIIVVLLLAVLGSALGSAVTARADNSMYLAIVDGRLAQVRALVAKDPQALNYRIGQYHATPLIYACGLGRAEIARWLIEKGARVNVADSLGNTPLHLAAEECMAGVVALLLKKGANVHRTTNEHGYTALHNAAGKGCNAVVTLLVKAGAKVNAKSNDGTTPLALAIARNRAVTAALLKKLGAK